MRDTLEHLVGEAMQFRDSDKILYILNQIDTTAREDNLEEVMGAWQRALSQRGLVSGDFYAIYNEEAMGTIEDPAVAERLKRKRDEDWKRIVDRIEGVKIERAYRIAKALEDYAKSIHRDSLPTLDKRLKAWAGRVLLADLLAALVLYGALGAMLLVGMIPSTPEVLLGVLLLSLAGLGAFHFKMRQFFAGREARRLEKEGSVLAEAFRDQTRWYRSIFRALRGGWVGSVQRRLSDIIDHSRAAIRRLNDQYVRPGGMAQRQADDA